MKPETIQLMQGISILFLGITVILLALGGIKKSREIADLRHRVRALEAEK